MKENRNIIQEKSYKFALGIIELYKFLKKNNEYILSKQMLRSGTSIGANVEEAGAALTKKDFIAKMSVASKEARETKYWLRLLRDSNLVASGFDKLFDDIDEIINILTAIIKTSQKNLKAIK